VNWDLTCLGRPICVLAGKKDFGTGGGGGLAWKEIV
jgi:hypothetical protein